MIKVDKVNGGKYQIDLNGYPKNILSEYGALTQSIFEMFPDDIPLLLDLIGFAIKKASESLED